MRNTSPKSVAATIDLLVRTPPPRNLQIVLRDHTVLSCHRAAGRQVLTFPAFRLPPSESELAFKSVEPPVAADYGVPEKAMFAVENPQVRVDGSAIGELP